MEHSRQLAEQIRLRIRELEDDLEAHRRALAVLEGATDGRPAAEVRRRADDRRRADERRRADDRRGSGRSRRATVSAEAVFDALTDGNDQAAVIAGEFGVATAAVRQRLAELEAAGRVTRAEDRRGTRWRGQRDS